MTALNLKGTNQKILNDIGYKYYIPVEYERRSDLVVEGTLKLIKNVVKIINM